MTSLTEILMPWVWGVELVDADARGTKAGDPEKTNNATTKIPKNTAKHVPMEGNFLITFFIFLLYHID
jgi:hypothetical protein